MNKKIQSVSFVLTVLLVLALSAIATVPVLADSGTTPPTVPSSGGRSSNKGSSNSLSQVPSGTKVVILDSNGDKVPLGSQQAQDILNSGDPLWCPSTVTSPNNSGLSGCTMPADNLADLISYIGAGDLEFIPTKTSSTIWISDTVTDGSSTAVIIDGLTTNFSPWAPYSLTIKGGWNGTYGSSTINSVSTLGVPLWINNWKNAVTISNLTINNAGDGDNGLEVDTTGNITLTNVQSNGATTLGGAYLNNCQWNGTNCVGTGTVTVTNSQFNNDYNTGLSIYSKGAITLNGVTANYSTTGAGVYIDNCNNQSSLFSNPCTSTATVTITGTNYFNHNYFNGLEVYSNGNITAGGLNADSNSSGYDGTTYSYWYSGGVQLENDFSGDKGTITITGTNHFTNNSEDGLDVYSNGAITTNNLNATGNGVQGNPPIDYSWVGVFLKNTGNSATTQNITMNGANDFESNFADGLDVYASGLLTANNITSNDNGTSAGTSSEFQGGVGAYFWGGKGVTLNNSTFNGNYSTISYDDGIPADSFSNQVSGLIIYSQGAIKVNNVTASGDLAGNGALLDNCLLDMTNSYCTVLGAPTVTLTGLNQFNNNAADGLDVNSFGNITSSDINAGENSGIGVNLFNANVNASLVNFNSKGTVTLTGTDVLNDNVGDGLDITSNGAIKAGNIHAINNSGTGADLDNSNSTTPQSVTLTNSNTFSYSGADGLDVFSNGAITLSTLSANGNGNTGVYLDNCANGGSGCTTLTSQSVTLSGNDSFNDNTTDGLDVFSNGIIARQHHHARGGWERNQRIIRRWSLSR